MVTILLCSSFPEMLHVLRTKRQENFGKGTFGTLISNNK